MPRTLPALLASTLLVVPALATADTTRSSEADLAVAPATLGWIGAESRPGAGPRTLMQVIPSLPSAASADALAAGTRWIIYMNRTGGVYTPGNNDARTNRSSLVKRSTTVRPWQVSNAAWQEVMSCVRGVFSPFDVEITDVDPGSAVPHIESIVSGRPEDIGLQSGVGGVSPFTEDCSIIPNAIVYTFAEVFGDDLETICEVVAQEAAHSFGLDHEFLASDPMTYLGFRGLKRFQNVDAECGEFAPRKCGLPNGPVCWDRQNSVELLTERIGPAQDPVGPRLIATPSGGAVVAPGFAVEADPDVMGSATRVELWIDNALSATKTSPPYRFVTSDALPNGTHLIQLFAYDGADVQGDQVLVTVEADETNPGPGEPPGGDGSGPNGADSDDTVVGGCDAGGGAPGVLVALGIYALVRRLRRRP
jgi:uncharacterized protein (TIGR03382 family)